MKKTVFLLISILCFLCSKAQNVEGIWQVDNAEIAAGYLYIYKFDKNGEFQFRPTEFDELKRITAIGGKYQIKKDTIYFMVEYIEERLGGLIERNMTAVLNNSWAVYDCKKCKTTFENIETWTATFSVNNLTDNKYIEIDKRKYYLITAEE